MTDYGNAFSHNGYDVRRFADGRITVTNPEGWHITNNYEGVIVAEYESGEGWIRETVTDNVKRTDNPMRVVWELVDNLDVDGIPHLEHDGWDQCYVCGTLGDFDGFCSADCVRQAQDTQD